jgi:hypothetical protein
MFLDHITDENFLLYASRNYYNPAAFTLDEFNEDMQRFKYVKRLLNRYSTTGSVQIQLLINHIIVLCNVFSVNAATEMLLFRNDKHHHSAIVTILRYLGYVDENSFTELSNDDKILLMLKDI